MLFSGNYVSGTTYQAAAAPAGNNYFYSSYTDTNNCTFLDTGIVNVLSPWVATYLLDDTVCVNAATNFTNDSAWLSYVINWGDGTINSNASHAYAQPGTYYINIRFFLAQCDTFIDDSVVIIPAPDASFSFAPNTICAGDTAAILFAPSSLYSYQWIYLSNTTSFPPVITNTNTGPDLISLPVTLIASVAQCGSASYTDSIHFYPATQALMALDYDSACSPMAVTIINNSIVSSLGASYQWFKNGVRWDSTDMRIHQQYDTLNAFSNDTTYTFMLVVYSCGQYDTVVQSIVVHPVDFTPVIYTSLPNPCRFQEIMLSASAIPGCTVAYNFGDGTTATASSGDTIMHTYYTAGYKVVYMVMHCACKSKTDSLVLNILPGPDLTVSAPSDTCNNKPVTITSNVTGVIAPAAYTTYFGDGTYDFTVPNPVHWYATGGIDTGWMVVTGVNGCYSDTARFIVHVHQTPNVLLSVTDTFACSSVLKLFSTDSLTPNSTYNWTLFYHNDSAHVTTYDGVLPFYADDIGTWLISLTAYNNNYPTCVATSDSFTVSVYQTPDAFFTVEQLYVKDKQCQFQVHNKSTPDNNIYFWDFGDSTYSYETNPAAHGYYKGRYQITLIARNGPCEDTAINPVQVDPYAQIFIPNIFTPDMDGTNDYFQLFGNTQDIDFLHVKIFNRAGEIVYDSYNVNFSWNGTYKGEPLAPAVFVYIIEISALADEDNRLMKGSITILR
ncbi:MAG TPA: gliding motility-associated C-terminal domain-containing protein [Chitinophagales bacterium]|nr:gliding motility-associated C-terminal domain-containing protein [Chitinophagales bacterium]